MHLQKILKPLHKIEADLTKLIIDEQDQMLANEDAITRLTEHNLDLAIGIDTAMKAKGDVQDLLVQTQPF